MGLWTLWETVRRRLYMSRLKERHVVDDFHRLIYDSQLWGGTWGAVSWLGTPTQKLPLDLWVYQEILHEIRPNLIIESGTYRGGSALFLANICDLLEHGRVISIDIEDPGGRPEHPRITYLLGSSISQGVLDQVRAQISDHDDVMVILDSDHSRDHVLEELRAYAPMVTPGSYLIVEDTNLNGHPVYPGHGPGPMEAVREYLREAPNFRIDRQREKFLITFNPSGYLLRARGG
jgi:cephalosporin hydroxylase